MSSNVAGSPKEVLEAFDKATTTFNLCPNRVWAVAKHNLPTLISAAKAIQCPDDHRQCTIDLCEYSQRDFTAVKQRHECETGCGRINFNQDKLVEAAKNGKSTVWALNSQSSRRSLLDSSRAAGPNDVIYQENLLPAHQPYMAISHVWSDGTGAGAWSTGSVNLCLYWLFHDIAEILGCEGIWWDTISIPKEKAARTKAIRRIQNNYQAARTTLVHDCFLRNSEWVDAEAACFAILMSPWFSRGWTALELANSRKVKVLFRGPHGFLVKDLDEEILAKDEHASEAHRRATDLIKSLRKGVTTLDDLLVVLGARCTSWPRDMAIISGLLVGVDISPEGKSRDVLQQDIYKRILTAIGRLSPGHLFHNSATICKGSSWCPINLFSMPISGSDPSLTIEDGLDLVGKWDIIPVNGLTEKNCVWTGTHLLLKMQLQLALQDGDKCVLLTECGTQTVDRALLVKLKRRRREVEGLCFQYVGALHFHPGLPKKEYVRINGRILGDASKYTTNQQANAWEYVKKRENAERRSANVPKAKTSPEIKDKTIKALWPTGGQPIREPGTGRTALHYAVFRNDRSSFRELLRISDIEAQDNLGQLPLHLAADRGHAEMFNELLAELSARCGSDIPRRTAILNASCMKGQTALHRAVFACSEIIVGKLLESGIDPNLMDKKKITAVHLSVRHGCEPLLGRLLDAGADPNLMDNNGDTALHMAASDGNEPAIEQLFKAKTKADPNLMDNDGNTPLHIAVGTKKVPAIERLLKTKADPNLANNNGATPLHMAIKDMFEPAIMRLLSDNRCDLNMVTPKTLTSLYWAVHYGNEQLVRSLVEKGADVNKACGLNKEIPLWYAVDCGKRSMIEYFISRGVSPNTKGRDRMSLLHLAVEKKDKETASLLLDNDATVHAKDESRLTPLHYAARQGSISLVELLLSKGAGDKMLMKGWHGLPTSQIVRLIKYDDIAELQRRRH